MRRWEYIVMAKNGSNAEQLTSALTLMGSEGWELTSTDANYLYFKKERKADERSAQVQGRG